MQKSRLMSESKKGKVIRVVNILDIENSIRPPDHQYSILNFQNALNHYRELSGHFVLDILDEESQQVFSESEWEMGILQSWKTSLNCFATTIYAGAILFASIAVECVLNHDSRLETYRLSKDRKWIDLTESNLKEAQKVGLPTNILLERQDNFPKISFVAKRNKIAHGDTEGYRQIHLPEKIELGITYSNSWQPTREQALEQIEQAKKFIISWAEQMPEVRLH